jgi:hypothetical protein
MRHLCAVILTGQARQVNCGNSLRGTAGFHRFTSLHIASTNWLLTKDDPQTSADLSDTLTVLSSQSSLHRVANDPNYAYLQQLDEQALLTLPVHGSVAVEGSRREVSATGPMVRWMLQMRYLNKIMSQ